MSAPMNERAIGLLETQIVELAELRNAHARDPQFKQWRQATLTVIQRLWEGDVARAERFRRVPFSPPSSRMSAKATRTFYEKGCAEASHLLRHMISELEVSPAIAAPTVRDPALDPGVAEDDFPLVDLGGGKKNVPADAGRSDRTPGARPASDPARPVAHDARSAPRPAPPEAPRPAEREPKRPDPPIIVRGTPPPDEAPEHAGIPTPADAPPRSADRKPPLREMLGFSATPLEDVQPASQRGPYEPLEAMEPESESYDIEYEAEAEAEIGDLPEVAADPETSQPEHHRAEMEAFLMSSPVLKASARPVVRQRPAAESAALLSPLANAVAALAAEVERFGVPEGHRAAVRAMLLDLARGLDRRDVQWTTLSESMRLALAYPALARRVIPLLVPFLDIAA